MAKGVSTCFGIPIPILSAAFAFVGFFVEPALAERAPLVPPGNYLTPSPFAPPKPTATPLVSEKEEVFPCVCEGKITVVCIPQKEFERRCGIGAGACAIREECRMYFPKGSKACDEIQVTTPMRPILMTDLAESLDITSAADPYSTESLLVGKPTASDLATAMISSLNFGSDKQPKLEDIIDQCLFEHELDHLCRETKNL
jgi:hypothetical protein